MQSLLTKLKDRLKIIVWLLIGIYRRIRRSSKGTESAMLQSPDLANFYSWCMTIEQLVLLTDKYPTIHRFWSTESHFFFISHNGGRENVIDWDEPRVRTLLNNIITVQNLGKPNDKRSNR